MIKYTGEESENRVMVMGVDNGFHVYDLLNEMIINKVSGASIGYEQYIDILIVMEDSGYGLEYQQQMRAENILDYDGKTYRLINLMRDGVEYHQRLRNGDT